MPDEDDLLTASWNVDEGLELRRQELQASHRRAGASGGTRELLRQYLNAALAGGVDRAQLTDPSQRGDLSAGLLDSLGLAVTDPVLAGDIGVQLDAFATQHAIASNDPTQLAIHQTRGRVDLGTGQFSHEATDLVVRGAGIDFVLRRSYRQQAAYFGPLGAGWDHPYNLWLRQVGDNLVRSMRSVREDNFARHPKFGQAGFSYWVPPDGQLGVIVEAAASYVWQGPGGQHVVYEEDPGRPLIHRATSLEDRFGNYLRLSYEQDRLAQVAVNHPDRRVTFEYDIEDRIIVITDYTGRRCSYDYDDHGDLVRVTRPATSRYPAGLATSYEYSTGSSSPPLAHNLLRIIDAAGQLVLENRYGENTGVLDFNRVVAQRRGDGETLFEYETVVSEFDHEYTDAERPTTQVNYTGRNGHPIHYVHNKFGNLLLKEEYVLEGGRARLLQWHHRYDRDGQLIATLTPEGSLTQHLYGRDQYRRVHQITDAEVADHSGLTFAERMAFGNLLATVRRSKRFSLASMDLSLGVWGDIFPDVVRAVDPDDVIVKRTYEPDFQQILTSSDPRFTERADPQHPEPSSYAATLTRYEYTGPPGQPNLLPARVRYPSCTLPDGSVMPGASDEFTSFDGHGRLLRAVDRAGSVTESTYYQPADGVREGYLKSHERDVGGLAVKTEQEVDQRGLTTAIHNPRSAGAPDGRFVTQIQINELDQLEQVQASPPFSFVARALYDRSGLLERVERDLKDEQGAPALGGIEVQRYIYDSEGNLTSHSLGGRGAASQLVTRHRYDEAGLRRATASPAGRTTTRTYDERMLEATVTRGAETSEASTRRAQYDGDGRKVADRSGRGNVTRYSYDAMGRLVLIEDALGNRTRRDYDKAGNLLVERFFERRGDGSFALLTRSECAYDELNRRVREGHNLFPSPIPVAEIELAHHASPGPGILLITEYYHDVMGRLERAVDPQGRSARTEWDALDRVSASIDPLDNRTETHYDAAGNLIRVDVRETIRDPATGAVAGEEVFAAAYTYDEVDRLTSQTDSLGNTTRFGYNSRGQLTRVTDALGNIHRTSHDVYGRKVTELRERTQSGLGGGAALSSIVTGFEYDPDGNLSAHIDANGNRTRQDFDALARRRAVVYIDGSVESYSYDHDDNLVTVRDPNGVLRTITLDLLGRPSRIDIDRSRLPPGLAVEGETLEEYFYDGQGRLLVEQNDFARIASKVDSLGRPYEETTTHLQPAVPGLASMPLR
jgi:YD repeat-containing protein